MLDFIIFLLYSTKPLFDLKAVCLSRVCYSDFITVKVVLSTLLHTMG